MSVILALAWQRSKKDKTRIYKKQIYFDIPIHIIFE